MTITIPKGPWHLQAGREILTTDCGSFFLSYEGEVKHPSPVQMDRIAANVAELPELILALQSIRRLSAPGIVNSRETARVIHQEACRALTLVGG